MKHHSALISDRHDLAVDLISGKNLLTKLSLLFLSHRRPNVCIKNVCSLCRFHNVICAEEFTCSVCPFHYLFVGSVAFGTSNCHAHSHLYTANDKRVSHIVTVTDIAELKSLGSSLMLTYGHKVRENLTGMTVIGKTVDNGYSSYRREGFYLLLIVGPYHNSVEVTRKNSCGILHRLATSYLKIS